MKRLIIFLLALCFLPLSAQQTDGGATAIVKDLAKKYEAFSSMKIQYTLKIEKDKKVLATSTGNVLLAGNQYVAEMAGQQLFCDGTTMWNYQPESNEVSIFDYDPMDEDNMLNPAKILKNWSKIYSAKLIREELQKNKMIQIVDLKPLKMSDVYKVRLFVDKDKKQLTAIAMYETDNTISTYYIDKFVPDATVAKSQFVFDVSRHPDVEVNDMR